MLPLAALAALFLTALVPPASPAAPSPEASLAPADTIVLTRDELQFSTNRLLIPVAGVELSEIRDSFRAPRSGGRVHKSIDIMAPMGTPVLAIADGEVTRRSRNRLGGITLFLTSPDGEYRFYYAHLQRYDPRATVGTLVQQGDTLGYVGTTGNARSPHLHLQMLRTNTRRGTPVNPYPLLKRSELYADEREVRG